MLTAYPDGGGYSIGYGHHGAKAGDVISRAEADRLFDADVERFERAVSLGASSPSQQQFDALVSFAYNVGAGSQSQGSGFLGSTLLKKHNAGDYAGAAAEFQRWNKSGGAVHQGLIARRAREASVYANGYDPFARPSFTPSSPAPSVPIVEPAPWAPEPAPSVGMSLAGVGLLFFCPSCGSRVESVGVEVKP